jgi:hypothetical protein
MGDYADLILVYCTLGKKQNYSYRSRDVVIAPAQPDHRKSKFGLVMA